MPPVALILSAGRTGTKFLAHYLGSNFDSVVARHEPTPSRSLRLASHAHMVGAVSRSRLIALLRRKRVRHIDPLSAGLYVESNPFLAGYADVLREVWSDLAIVHIVRDPREHVRSSLNHGTASGWKGLANRYVPHWYPDVTRILKLKEPPGDVGLAAGVWTVMNRTIRDAAPHYPRYRVFHYEQVFDSEHSGLREICDWLGLGEPRAGAGVSPSERINAGRLDAIGHWPEWTPEQCAEVERICQPLMGEYGYGRETQWREKLRAAGTIPDR